LFIEYISDLLPDLGAVNIKQETFTSFVEYILGEKINYLSSNDQTNNINSSGFNKGNLKFKELLDIYTEYIINEVIPKKDLSIYGVVIFSKEEIKKIFLTDFSTYKLNERIVKFKSYIQKLYKNKISDYIFSKEREYEVLIENLKMELKENKELQSEISALIIEKESVVKRINTHATLILNEYLKNFNKVDVVDKYRKLISDKSILSYNGIEILSSKEINSILEKSKYGFYEDDLAGILYLFSKLNNTELNYYKHIVIDESQDLSPFEIYTLRSFVYNNSFTIVGDINQRIIPDKLTYRESIIKTIFDDSVNFKEYKLNKSYRSSYEIMMFAKEILKFNSVNKEYLPEPIERHGNKPLIIGKHSDEDIVNEIIKLVKNREERYNNVAIVFRNKSNCEKYYNMMKDKLNVEYITEEKKYLGGICIFPAYLTKGLEFDMVIIGDCDNKSYRNNRLETNLLYVQSTRAMHNLVIMYCGAMSPLLLKIGKELYEDSETDQDRLFKTKIAKDSLMMLLKAKFGEINDDIDEIIKEELNYEKIQSFITKAAIENDLNKIFEININKKNVGKLLGNIEEVTKEEKEFMDQEEDSIESIIESFLED